MIKDNQKQFNILNVALDGLITAFSYILTWYIMFGSNLFYSDSEVLPAEIYLGALVFIIPVYLILYSAFHLYIPKRIQGRRTEFANICKANTIGVLIFALVLFLTSKNPYVYNFSRRLVVLFYISNTALQAVERTAVRRLLYTFRSSGYNQKLILLVGYSRAAENYIDRILVTPEWGYQIYGIVDDSHEVGYEYKGIPVIGHLERLKELLKMNVLDEIAVTLSLSEYRALEEVVAECEKSGVHTKFIPDYNNIIPTIPYIQDLDGLPVINIRHAPLSDLRNRAAKRIVDILGAIAAIIIFSPVMLLTAAIVKLTSPGPVLFAQERVGLHNRPFRMYKFRSMEVQTPADEKSQWTRPRDPRVTPIGKFIRRTSIDEMPQFFNILSGNMSLVGPRPERPFFVERFKEEIPRYMIKHQVRPGLTGWAQINGFRGDTSITKRIEHDLYYIENWTLGLDVKILFLTIFRGFINKNAY